MDPNRRLISGVTTFFVGVTGLTGVELLSSLLASNTSFVFGECGDGFAGVPGVAREIISHVLGSYDDCGSLRQNCRSIPG